MEYTHNSTQIGESLCSDPAYSEELMWVLDSMTPREADSIQLPSPRVRTCNLDTEDERPLDFIQTPR